MTSAVRTATHPGEGGHWYLDDGTQVTAVPSIAKNAKPGQMVERISIIHARHYDLGPGVTTVIGCAEKPGVEYWRRTQTMLATLRHPAAADINPDPQPDDEAAAEALSEFRKQIERDADAVSAEARDRGTSFHAAIQAWFEGNHDEADASGWGPWCRLVHKEMTPREFYRTRPRPEVACSHPLGYGTKADAIGGGWLLDFKGKDELTVNSTKLRDEHFMQLAATREALRHHGHTIERCAIGFFSRKTPDFVLAPVTDADLDRGFAMFHALLVFWQMKNRHQPQWGSTAPKE